jgi:hypothetical protein
VTIKTSKFLIEAVIRENTNLTHLTEMINLFAEFKNYPKKFKEIFQNYLRNQYTNALTQNKLVVIPPSQ